MDRSDRQLKFPIPDEEYVCAGHTACPGCSAVLAMRYVLKALGPRTIILIPPGCSGPIAGGYPISALKIPALRIAFGTTASSASGVRAALNAMGKKHIHVLAWAGDGATLDIGLQALSAAAERNDDIIYVCYDNEAYMNTGVQKSSSSPEGVWTSTTPGAKDTPKKDIVGIMAAHKIPYIATASVGYPKDLIRKMEKAKNIAGTRFIYIFSPCTTGWQYPPELTIQIAKLATQTGIFPLYEIENGERYILNRKRGKKPLKEYVALQGRFRRLDEQGLRRLEAWVEKRWDHLTRMSSPA
jgi:2-oxoisovalerate ferredoxin oxidoreductase beta subunit